MSELATAPRTFPVVPAVVAAAIAAALAAWGNWGGDEDHTAGEYLVVLAIIAVAAIVVFGWVVPRWMGSATAGLVLGVLALLTVLVFWTGLPVVLGVGAIVLGQTAWTTALGKAAAVLGAAAIVLDVIVYIVDMS